MLQSKLFYKTLKKTPKDAEAISHKLLLKAGFVDQLMAGVYNFLPLGFKVLKKIENIIRQEMEKIGGQEILMPVLHPKENWQKTGRWDKFETLFKIKGNNEKEYALGPTHEEVISPLAKKIILSYKDLPVYLFQLQTKFRDEIRVKSGLLRTREFLMKDLYSFHTNQKDLDAYYEKIDNSYVKIFDECGIPASGKGKITFKTLASGGSFSKYSHEYQTITKSGEDIIYICKKCGIAINKEIIGENKNCPNCRHSDFEEKKAVEVGNIFKLGDKYALPFDLEFRDKDGKEKPVIMGCYGIGLSRLMAAIVEVNNDEKGIIWPEKVAPFSVHLIQIENSRKVKQTAEKLYNDLSSFALAGYGRTKSTSAKGFGGLSKNIEVLYDDREDKTPGEKFAETDLIGIPYRVVVSEKTLGKDSVEIKRRNSNVVKLVKINQLLKLKIKNEKVKTKIKK